MGGRSSKQSRRPNPYAAGGGRSRVEEEEEEKKYNHQRQQQQQVQISDDSNSKVVMENHESPTLSARYANTCDDEFYDGIPRYKRSLSLKSRSLRVAKEQQLKTTELSILSFEVANTIVKGSNIMQSLSKRSIRQLKEVVLPAEGVQKLISTDMDELLRIVAADKREELKVFSGEVIRFGNRCKDPQWHNLDRFFEKRSRDRTPQKQLMEVAESVMMQLMTSVQFTAELYQELHALDRSEQDYQRKRLEQLTCNATQRGDRDNRPNILAAEIKRQRKLVKNLKKKSLWSRSMEEVMEKLVDIVLFLNQEIYYTFGVPESETPEKGTMTNQQKLGPAGLSLHYANIILQIDSLVARSSSMPPNSRETLYQSLPPNIKDSLKSKLQSFHVEKELTVKEIKDEMEKTLHWLAVVATQTAKAHHGFGWVGEWANTGSEMNRRTVGPNDVMQIETLHHADRHKTEAYILNLLLWLNYLVTRSKAHSANRGALLRPSPVRSPCKEADKKQPVTKSTNT
ncbi:hypothetical protein BUALT_Bualt04G0064600 [Buddleja alternifolia]|uniref:Uncharacterized protein n=1 Tax=Buddleja alternifolia TaxID=168488 RepID=A0AAV6XLU8_9LAMI|nr:hypothetical protein BUALT_Bualt04G0064600 [Buddleja alternifolia]